MMKRKTKKKWKKAWGITKKVGATTLRGAYVIKGGTERWTQAMERENQRQIGSKSKKSLKKQLKSLRRLAK